LVVERVDARAARNSSLASAAMPPFQVIRHGLDARSAAAVQALANEAVAAAGHPAFDAQRLEQALRGEAPGFVAALEWDPTGTALAAYAQAVRGVDGWNVEHVERGGRGGPGASPGDRGDATRVARRLLSAVLDALVVDDDTEVTLWAYQATETDDRLAAGLGLRPARELRQMRRPLPVEETIDPSPSLPTRPFVVGRDEAAWLRVNHRAFRALPDQGGWTLTDLQARERAPWFDPAGFLLHEREGRLAGFCWTKVHDHTDPPMGEIFVVGVDPDWQGRGLGRALVLAGLDHLARQRHMPVGMLYVDAANPAIRLYEALGFTLHHVDRAYRR